MVRAINVVCGIHNGGRPCHQKLGRFGLLDGEVVVLSGDTAIRGGGMDRLGWTDGTTIRIVACEKHGVLRIGEPEIAEAIRRGQKAVPTSMPMPGFRTRHETVRGPSAVGTPPAIIEDSV
jgi:hypothetical protein